MNSLSRSSRLSVYIYNDTGYIFCLRFFLQAIASFFPSWRFYHVYLFSVCHLLPLIVTCVPFRNFWRHRIENLTHFYRANKSKIFAVTHYIFYWIRINFKLYFYPIKFIYNSNIYIRLVLYNFFNLNFTRFWHSKLKSLWYKIKKYFENTFYTEKKILKFKFDF